MTGARRFGAALEALHVFIAWAVPVVEGFPRSYKFTLGDRIVAAGLDTLERLIEATYDRDRTKPLAAANLAIENLRHLFRLAFTLKCIDERRYEHAARSLDEIGRLIGAWKKSSAAYDARDADAAGSGLEFEVEHHLDELKRARAERAEREQDRVEKPRRAAEAARAGHPVAERAFPIELPGVADWPNPPMIAIPPGRFLMGSPEPEERWSGFDSGHEPQHEVRIDYAFALGQHTVTFAEWDAALAAGAGLEKPDDEDWGRENRPVINVSWEDAQAFLAWLNEKAGLAGCPDAYRLPSEAEWEYACRAKTHIDGTTTPFSFGETISTAQANYDGNCTYGTGKKGVFREQTVPVGSFPANPFGLHDMHGNVWEWCQDCWNVKYNGAPTDGSAWTAGDCFSRALRGGSWYVIPRDARSEERLGDITTYRNYSVGFRLARTVLLPES